jgi:hypothetical protein
MPYEGFGGLEIGLGRPGRSHPFERGGKALETLDQGGFVVHPVSLNGRIKRDFACGRGLVLL